jgi:hypothetical protein
MAGMIIGGGGGAILAVPTGGVAGVGGAAVFAGSAVLATGAAANINLALENLFNMGGTPGGDGGLRVVNTKMPHAAKRAVERAGFASEQEAREALQAFGRNIETNGIPGAAVRDAAGHIIIPGFGNGGAVVYRQSGNKLTLQTVLTWIDGLGTPIH